MFGANIAATGVDVHSLVACCSEDSSVLPLCSVPQVSCLGQWRLDVVLFTLANFDTCELIGLKFEIF